MLLTLSTTHQPATDIGFVLHKNPSSVRSVAFGFGNAHVFYPEATEERCTAALLLEVDPVSIVLTGSLDSPAEARIGRPATPGSVAGVARRTTRRTIRRTARYVAVLPGGCARATLYGAAVWSCGGVYYQPSGNQYVVVVVN